MLGQMINWAHPLAKGLVGCWIMNEGSGNRVYDLSGNGNDGDFVNDPAWLPGRAGMAIEFDGGNDYIFVNDINGIINTYSISLWVKPKTIAAAPADPQDLFSGSANKYEPSIEWRNSKFRFVGNRGESYFLTSNTFNIDLWHHVVFIADNKSRNIFVNGQKELDSISAFTAGWDTTGHLIGAYDVIPDNFFNGSIDDVRIWNRALSAQEVSQLYYEPYAMFLKAIPIWIYRIARMIYIKRFRSKRTIYNFSAKGQAYYLKARNETYTFTAKAA